MKNRYYVLAVCLLSAVLLRAETYYVTTTGTGDGSSWERASGDLNTALFQAESGDEIWIAAGTYRTTNNEDRKVSFAIPSGVALYGGFEGNETEREQRNFTRNLTILSGEIGGPEASDNSYNVVFLYNADEQTRLDGFVISGGNANGMGNPGERARCGGGLYNFGADGLYSRPRIVNCRFVNNRAHDGAAVYNNGAGGDAGAVFEQCHFEGNVARLDGGAVYNDGRRGGICTPEFTSCTISGNQAGYGGAMVNFGSKGISTPVLVQCTLENNRASVRGGAMYNVGSNGSAAATLTACVLQDNRSKTGPAIAGNETK